MVMEAHMAQALRWLVNLIVAVVLTAGGALSPALAGARHYPGPRHHRAVPAHRSVAHRSPSRPSPAQQSVGATASGTITLPARRTIHEARGGSLHLLFALAAPGQTRGPPRPSVT